MYGLRERYYKELRPALARELSLKSEMAVPRIAKIVVNVGLGEAVSDPKLLDVVSADMARVTAQKPTLRRARKSVAGFHLRKGMPVGLKVTLRGQRGFDFLERLICVALPRVRDFTGLNPDSFDGRGSYTFGIEEQTVFPEIDIDKVSFTFGMDVTVVTTARTDEEAFRLLSALGVPFRKS